MTAPRRLPAPPRHGAPDARTTVPEPPPPAGPGGPAEEPRRELAAGRRHDRLNVLGALAAAIAFTAVLFHEIAPLDGRLGAVVVAMVAYLVIVAVLTSLDEDGPAVRDRVAASVVTGIGLILLGILFLVLLTTGVRALPALVHGNFWVSDMHTTAPNDPLTEGGVAHAIVGTLEQMGIALALTVPLGITCAVFLTEVPGRFSRFVRTLVEAMTALPSIVAGLFVYAALIIQFHAPKSGLAAGIALSVMALPIIIRAADVVLRLVPATLKEASYALGSSQWRTVWHVVLPTSRSGLMTAVILGTARAIGETSPVLVTAGFTQWLSADPRSGPQVSLPLQAFNNTRFPQPEMVTRGFGAAAVLLLLVLLLFAVARVIGGRGPGELSARQLRRRAVASAIDARRFAGRAARPRTEPRARTEESDDVA